MGLIAGPALSDRARIVATIEQGPRVEGRRQAERVASAWCPARLVVGDGGEQVDGQGRRRSVERARLVVRLPQGERVPRAQDAVEVQARDGAETSWLVDREPEQIATRRVGRALLVELRRAVEPGAPEEVSP